MGVVAAALRELVAAGVTGDALVTAIERIEEAGQPKRTAAADRMVRYRARQKEASHVTHVTHGDAFVSPKETPLEETPLEITPSTSLRSDKSTTARARASRIPENFVPDMEAAYAAGLSESEALIEVANFLDYWRSKPTNATKLDWPATWRMWCRKATKDRGSMQGRAPPRQQRSQNGFAAFALELAERDYEPADHNDYEPSRNATAGPGDGQARAADRGVDAERPITAGRGRSPAH